MTDADQNRDATQADTAKKRPRDSANPTRNVALTPSSVQEIDIVELWRIVWRGKWFIAGLTTVFVALALAYALSATEWYRAEVLLAPAEEQSGSNLSGGLGGLGSLAGLAGISVGETKDVQALAILGSRDFIRAFIAERELIPVLFAEKWDPDRQVWRGSEPGDQPDLQDAVKFFLENVHRIERDSQTGLVTLAIEWTAADQAAVWATDLVRRLNTYTRETALREAENNITYLQQQMEKTSVVSLRDAIASLIERELQKAMLANGAEEYSYKVIDSAQPPKEPFRPKKLLILLLAIVLGGLLSLFIVLLRHSVRQRLAVDISPTDPQGNP